MHMGKGQCARKTSPNKNWSSISLVERWSLLKICTVSQHYWPGHERVRAEKYIPLNLQPHRYCMLASTASAPRVTRCSLGLYWSRDLCSKHALAGWGMSSYLGQIVRGSEIWWFMTSAHSLSTSLRLEPGASTHVDCIIVTSRIYCLPETMPNHCTSHLVT